MNYLPILKKISSQGILENLYVQLLKTYLRFGPKEQRKTNMLFEKGHFINYSPVMLLLIQE